MDKVGVRMFHDKEIIWFVLLYIYQGVSGLFPLKIEA